MNSKALTARRSQYIRKTGVPVGVLPSCNPAHKGSSPSAPAVCARRLNSMGLVVVDKLVSDRGWLTCAVLDRVTGEPRGRRWIRYAQKKFQVVKERPEARTQEG